MAERHGLYAVDYPPADYAAHQREARHVCSQRLQALVGRGGNVVVDRAFFAREDRDQCRAVVERAGGRCVLVYLRAGRRLLWSRICERRLRGSTRILAWTSVRPCWISTCRALTYQPGRASWWWSMWRTINGIIVMGCRPQKSRLGFQSLSRS